VPNPIKIVSTKILLQSQKQMLSADHFSLVEEDFIQIKNIDFEIKQLNKNLILSSQNAVKSVLKYPELKSKNVFCVGLKTKATLEKNGFKVIVCAEYAADLAKIITVNYTSESFTFFCGDIRRDELPNALIKNKIKYNEIVVYETKLIPHQINEPFDGVLFFSPSGVNSFLEKNSLKNKTCFCIGTTTAKALEKKHEVYEQNLVIALQPTVESVITEAIKFYKRLKPKAIKND